MNKSVYDFIDDGRNWAKNVKPQNRTKVCQKAKDRFFANTKSDLESVQKEIFCFGVFRQLEEDIRNVNRRQL